MKKDLGKKLIFWLGSYLVIVILSVFHFGIPLFPLLLAGGVTLLVTLIHHCYSRQ